MKKVLIVILFFSLFLTGCNSAKLGGSMYDVKVNDIVINKSHAYVDVGNRIILLAQVFPFNANNQKILWKSDNPSIASVSGGIVIGKSEGRTIISAISEEGEYYATCTVFVSTPKLNYENY
ncbi:MAG: Ig-like domain-containing protein [Clostridiales bacterium]|nr:Ig-like domain-containing protein [Clostridiales bacterium]